MSSGTVEVGVVPPMEGVGNDVTIDPSSQSMEHGFSMLPESTEVEGATMVSAYGPGEDPPLGPSLETVTNDEVIDTSSLFAEHGFSMPPASTKVEAANVVCTARPSVDPQLGPSLKTKPAVVHGTSYTDSTRQPRAQKGQKDSKLGVMAVEMACVDSAPTEESIDPKVLDMHMILVQGPASGPSVWDLGNVWLTEQVSTKFMRSCKKCCMF
ncbi:hypothetical protein Cgig2_021321 [Carnegiea gigantea]|uniref:Uncharacterized protein n=1 Tax=Carnegiea gigantea TaxID=171969 RepID=A0A9Q1JGX2_9CARY|nr:hypothetical protein Cgig2_021321 [Carnegiea gigantea]